MRRVSTLRSRQRGVVAVIAGLTAVTLFAFGGVALDLGHLYIGKTELQNASDAAALAGAKELNNKLSGVTAAINRAKDIAAQHKYDFKTSLSITAANIRLGSCPNADNMNTWGRPALKTPTCTFVAASSVTSDAQASGLTFIEVDTGDRTFDTFLMRVAGNAFNATQTAGYSVAGRYQNAITPIGVCAVDPSKPADTYAHNRDGLPPVEEFVELGFRRGVTYNLFELNPLASGPSDPYLINPVDTPPACNPANSSAAFTAPFICSGNSAITVRRGDYVNTNTGMTASLAASLNSRFDDYKPPSVCTPASAPPDINVKRYPCHFHPTLGPGCSNNSPIDWMDVDAGIDMPVRQSVDVELDDTKPFPKKPKYWPHPRTPGLSYKNYGPLWSYTRPRHPNGTKPGAPFTLEETTNSDIYNDAFRVQYFNSNYPTTTGAGFPSGTPAAPYNQIGNAQYFEAPKIGTGVRDRRVLNIVIVDCTVPPTGSGACGSMLVAGIGKFFMQVPAEFTGGPNRQLSVEFAGLLEDIPLTEIRLFR